jgi:hypothetical protein
MAKEGRKIPKRITEIGADGFPLYESRFGQIPALSRYHLLSIEMEVDIQGEER